ncbi:MAG: hypothetical protein FJ023_03045 [Chloroflexi bacterium]|nr:hypothetical protein [Chloroflexota bacterium]
MRRLGMLCSMLMLALLLLATSCVTREVPVVETYYETEYRTEYKTESYSDTVETVIHSAEGKTFLNHTVQWYTDVSVAGFEGIRGSYYYGYELAPSGHSRSQVKVRVSPGAQLQEGLIRVYDLTGIGQIPPRPTPFQKLGLQPEELYWLDAFNAVLTSARVLGELRTGIELDDYIVFDAEGVREFAILATTWHAYAITSVLLVWSDDVVVQETVTKERQVPYQVPYQVEKQRTVTKTEVVPIWDVILGR